MKKVMGILLTLAAGLSQGEAQDRKELPRIKGPPQQKGDYFERRNDGVWIKPGEIPLRSFLAFLSDYATLPLIIADSGLDLSRKIPVKEEVKVTSASQVSSLLREGGTEVESVVLPNGMILLQARRFRVPLTGQDQALIFKPGEANPVSKTVSSAEGGIAVTNLLHFFANFQGEEVFCDGSVGEVVRRMEIAIVVDIPAVDGDIVKEMLECYGVHLRHVVEEGEKTHWRASLTTSPNVPRIRSPGKATDTKK